MNRKQKVELLNNLAKGVSLKDALPTQSWVCNPLPESKAIIKGVIDNNGMCNNDESGESITSKEFDKRIKAGLIKGFVIDYRNGIRMYNVG